MSRLRFQNNSKPLTRDKIIMANKRIAELYPIKEIPIENLLPSFKVFLPCLKKCRVYKLKRDEIIKK